ncbi:MAG: F0F1 ATP synthase subunit epsilon [Deltaproteobacteria bacterium]|nr:MAG: F0F1 ATP synthase subunit epsilon [Deltaproteobacteria bacterium]
MGKILLEIITPEKVLVSKEVDMVVAPGIEGEFGVLEDHVSFLSSIVPGELRYTVDGKTEYCAVMEGFVEVSDNKVSVLVDAAERAEEIDVERAKRALERAQKRLEQKEGVDIARAEAALRRAMARLKVAGKVKG